MTDSSEHSIATCEEEHCNTISQFRNELNALHQRRERLEGLIEGVNISLDKLDIQK